MLRKYILIILVFITMLNASWFQEFQKGLYDRNKNKIYALSQVNINQNEYKTIAFEEAISDISNQLYTQVTSEQFLNKTLHDDKLVSNFKQKIHIVSSLPIHGVTKEQESEQNGKYILLLSFDKKNVASIYKEKANELVTEINVILADYKNKKDISTKESILNTLSKKLTNYEKYSLVAKLLKQTGIKEPKIKPYFVEKELRELYNITTKNIENLVTVLAQQIKKSNIKNSIKVMPFFYEDKGVYSTFSSELKNYLEKELSKTMNITSKQDSIYKLAGNFFIKNNHIVVKATLYDSFGDIELITMAKMKINNKNIDYYKPKLNEYSNLNQPVLNTNLNIQVRMNKMTKNLLFKKGQVVNIEVKVSKEAYISIIGNMRTKQGKQIQYLMPLNENIDKIKYQKFIPYQNSNLWVSIGEFEVYPPFGVEVLQVFATNLNIANKLPYTKPKLIDGEEYDVIVDKYEQTLNANRSIAKMRGLKLANKNKELEKAEAILKFTTVKR